MTKTGWWHVKFDITLEGEEIRFDDLDEVSQEHIAKCIQEGYTSGEIVIEEDYDGQIICCPECGKEITIEYDSARCDDCGWSCSDAELEEILNEDNAD